MTQTPANMTNYVSELRPASRVATLEVKTFYFWGLMAWSLASLSKELDPVQPPKTVRLLSRQLRLQVDKISIRRIIKVLKTDRITAIDFLFLNTYLMDLQLGEGLLELIGLDKVPAKPRVKERAHEIGSFVSRRWDLVALAEVWLTRDMDRVLDHWAGPYQSAHRITKYMGGDRIRDILFDAFGDAGSTGLLTVSSRVNIIDSDYMIFNNETGLTEVLQDGLLDGLSSKGVLRVQLSPSSGMSFQLYTTHLQAGKTITALMQVCELAAYVLSTRGGTEPGLIAGDFNIDTNDDTVFPTEEILGNLGHVPAGVKRAVREGMHNGVPSGEVVRTKTSYQMLRDVMSAVGFYDLWSSRNGTPGYTIGILERWSESLVCPADPENSDLCADIIPTYEEVINTYNEVQQESPDEKIRKPKRIDFLFASEPREGDSLCLTYTRPRRPRHMRDSDSPGFSEIKYLSDHLGISTTIVLSKK